MANDDERIRRLKAFRTELELWSHMPPHVRDPKVTKALQRYVKTMLEQLEELND